LPGYEDDKDARCDFFKSWLLPGARTADPRRFIDFTILDEFGKRGSASVRERSLTEFILSAAEGFEMTDPSSVVIPSKFEESFPGGDAKQRKLKLRHHRKRRFLKTLYKN
jgi:hypothetical protein